MMPSMRKWLISGVVALIVVAIAVVALTRGEQYEARRQVATEDIPGTLTFSLGAVPKGFTPRVTPEEAFRIAWDEPVETETYLTLAVMQDTYYGSDPIPDWIFISRAQCYPSAKGDLVSPARAGTEDEACDERNLALVTVDALHGEPAQSFTGYDWSREWEPTNMEPLFTAEQMHAAGGGGDPLAAGGG